MVFVITLFMPLIMVLDGLVIRDFWSWFIMPIFNKSMALSATQLPYLTVVQAIGLSFMWNILSLKTKKTEKTANEEYVLRCINHVLAILFLWGLGCLFWKWFI